MIDWSLKSCGKVSWWEMKDSKLLMIVGSEGRMAWYL